MVVVDEWINVIVVYVSWNDWWIIDELVIVFDFDDFVDVLVVMIFRLIEVKNMWVMWIYEIL